MLRISVVWTDDTGTEQTADGKLEDLSAGGMGVRVNTPILIGVGSKLVVQTPQGYFPMVVARSSQTGRVCLMGLKKDVPEKPTGG